MIRSVPSRLTPLAKTAILAGGLSLSLALSAQISGEPPVVLPKVEVAGSAPLIKVAEYHLLEPRFMPAAVVQGDSIYVISGENASGVLIDSIERFDVRTGKSEIFAHLEIARRGHRAVLFENRIYVFGGLSNRREALESAPRYASKQTPPPGVVVAAPSMDVTIKAEAGQTPPGRDLAGDEAVRRRFAALDRYARSAASNQGDSNAKPGDPDWNPPWLGLEDSVEMIDLATRKVSRSATLPAPWSGFACVVRAGKIYVIGGTRFLKKESKVAHTRANSIFDPATGLWSEGAPMTTARDSMGVLVDGGVIVVPGGYDGVIAREEVAVFSPNENLWRALPPLCKPVSAQSVVFLDHYLFLFGNYSAPEELIAYDLIKKTSEAFTLQYTPARHTAAVVHDSKIYVIGGKQIAYGTPLDTVQVFALRKNYRAP